MLCSEMNGVPLCQVFPWGAAACAGVAAAIGAEASGAFGRHCGETYSFGKSADVNLPEAFRLTSNPFDDMGARHDLRLNYINTRPNLDAHQTKIKDYDKDEWTLTLKAAYPEKSNDEITEMYNFAKDRNVLTAFNYSKYTVVNTQEDVNRVIAESRFSAESKSTLNRIVTELNVINTQSDRVNKSIDFVNSEIRKILQSFIAYFLLLLFLQTVVNKISLRQIIKTGLSFLKNFLIQRFLKPLIA
jgi:hypothetical protein